MKKLVLATVAALALGTVGAIADDTTPSADDYAWVISKDDTNARITLTWRAGDLYHNASCDMKTGKIYVGSFEARGEFSKAVSMSWDGKDQIKNERVYFKMLSQADFDMGQRFLVAKVGLVHDWKGREIAKVPLPGSRPSIVAEFLERCSD